MGHVLQGLGGFAALFFLLRVLVLAVMDKLQIQQPTLILWGAQDRQLRLENVHSFLHLP